jgi:phosphatidate cytidylyltransferase
LQTRILTSAALLPLLAVLYLAPAWGFLALAGLACLRVTWEAAGLFRAADRRPMAIPACVGVALLCLSFYRPEQLPLSSALAGAVAGIVGAAFLVGPGVERALDAIGSTLCVLLFPGFLLAFQIGLRGLGEGDPGEGLNGPALLLFLYAVVFGNDSAAYFTGRLLGRHPLSPQVSPKKTVEGFLGGVVIGVLLGLVLDHFFSTGLGRAQVAGFGALVAVAAVFGDLSISLLKRSAGVKDTAQLLPGHGGLLDRLDGLLFTSPLLYLACTTPALIVGGP